MKTTSKRWLMVSIVLFVSACSSSARPITERASVKDDIWCSETQVADLRSVASFDAFSEYETGGISAAVSAAEERYGALQIAGGPPGRASTARRSDSEAAKRGCDLIIRLEDVTRPYTGPDGVSRGVRYYQALLAKRLDD